ncbi:MAG: hypothetical protein WB611_28350 [Stellaceae bacterium]
MATLLDKKRSATSNVQSPDETTLDHLLSRITALAPMVARLARDIEQDRRLPAELVSALKSARIYGMLDPGVTAASNLTRQAPFKRSRPWPGSMDRWAGMP